MPARTPSSIGRSTCTAFRPNGATPWPCAWRKVCHVITVGLLGAIGLVMNLGPVYLIGVAIVAALLIYEHSLVKPNDLSKVNLAFFNVNGYISITIFVATLLALTIPR